MPSGNLRSNRALPEAGTPITCYSPRGQSRAHWAATLPSPLQREEYSSPCRERLSYAVVSDGLGFLEIALSFAGYVTSQVMTSLNLTSSVNDE